MATGKVFACRVLAAIGALGLPAGIALGEDGAVPDLTLRVRGVVFIDADENGRRDAGETGVAGALVSDGESFAETHGDGQYALTVAVPAARHGITFPGRSSHVFLVNPPGTFFVTPSAVALPSQGGECRADFGVRDAAASEDGNFTFIHTADPQFSSEGLARRFTISLREMAACDAGPAFILNSGDSVEDGTEAELQLFSRSVRDAELGIPLFTSFGGHSALYGRSNQKEKPAHFFERYVGPMYYSFNYGGCHFIIITSETDFLSRKHSLAQGRWLAADLARTAPQRPIVWVQHRALSSVPAVLAGRRIAAMFHGHNHLNARYTVDDVPVLVTSPPISGGFAGAPAGFRVVTFRGGKLADTKYRFGGVSRQSTLVTPAPGATVKATGFRVVVSVYDTARHAERVECFLDNATAAHTLLPEGDFAWVTKPLQVAEGVHGIRVRVTDSAGEVWPELGAEFTAAEGVRPEPGPAWPSFGGGPEQTHQARGDVDPPLQLAWCAPTGGSIGLSSPVVADGRVYIAAQDFGQRSERCAVFAFDAASGRQLWRFPTETAVKHTVCAGGGKVFAYTTSCTLYAIDAATGKAVWQKDFETAGSFNASWPPSYADGRVFAYDKEGLAFAFDVTNGQEIWRVQTKPWRIMWWAALSTPIAQGRIFLGDGAYEADTGSKLYGYQNTEASSSAVADGVYTGYVDGKLSGLDAATGETVWKSDLGGSAKIGLVCSAAVATDGDVYAGQYGTLVSYDPTENRERWRFAARDQLIGLRTPRFPRSSMIVSTPAVSGKWVYCGTNDGWLYILERKSGSEVWSYEIGTPVGASPAVTGNAVFVAALDGCVYAFAAAKTRAGAKDAGE